MSDDRSLVWRYAATFATLVSLLLLAGGAVSAWFAYRESMAAVARLQQAQAGFAARAIADFLEGTRAALANSASKFDADADPEAQRLELASLLRHRPELTALRWQRADGRDGAALARFGVADATRWRAPLPEPNALGGLGPVGFHLGSEPHAVLALPTPEGGRLLAELNLKPVTQVLQRLAPDAGGVPYVVDAQGRLLGHPDLGLVLGRSDLASLPQVRRALAGSGARQGGLMEGRDAEGAPVLATAASVDATGWTVLVEQPHRLVMAPVSAAVLRSLALMVVGVLAALAVSVVMARRLVRPLVALQAQAKQLADAQAVDRIAESGGGELTQLAVQFNRMAARLNAFHAAQEARIAERTAALAAANEAKTRFLAAASHDLRQPVHALTLFAAQLQGRTLPPDAARIAQQIQESARALATLVEALLDLSRLDVGGVQARPQAVDLRTLLSRLAAQWQPGAAARGLSLRQFLPRRGPAPWAHTDPLLLERILGNLVANAIRHTTTGGVLVACRRRGPRWQLVVADTGSGIAPEELPHVFDEFYRAPSTVPSASDSDAGLGLGLAIVRRLAGLLGVHVTLRSRVDRGTVAGLELPAVDGLPAMAGPAPADARPERQAVDTPADLPPLRVLVIDDDASSRDAVRGLLHRWRCSVQSADGLASALEAAPQALPDLVLCDLDLGAGGDGIDVVRRLRQAWGPLRCAYITGGRSPDRLAEARASGDPVLLKPVAPARLRALLTHASSDTRAEASSRPSPARTP